MQKAILIDRVLKGEGVKTVGRSTGLDRTSLYARKQRSSDGETLNEYSLAADGRILPPALVFPRVG